MAEFCTKCAIELFGEEAKPEINVQEIFESLEEGMCESGYLCEGCGLTLVGNIDGKLQVIRVPEDDQKLSTWEDY